jgi:hypothetical protein
MSPDDLREAIRDYVPLRIHMSNGRSLDIVHRDFVTAIADEAAAVVVQENGRSKLKLISLININEIERLTAEPQR